MEKKPTRKGRLSELSPLFLPPLILLLLLITYAIGALGNHLAMGWRLAFRWLMGGYSIALAVALFAEGAGPFQKPARDQALRLMVGLGGLAASAFFIFEWYAARAPADLRFGAFTFIASAFILKSRLADQTRAVAFALMALAEIHSPLAGVRPPFLSLGVVNALAAVLCLLRAGALNRRMWRGAFRVLIALLALFLAMSGAYCLPTVYGAWPLLWFIFYVSALTLLTLAAVAMLVLGVPRERLGR